jgi:uncharacterized protein (TIGR00369 family)
MHTAPNRERFAPLAPERARAWSNFPNFGRTYFPRFVGLVLEELRTDYARMRLPYRPELEQPAGVLHGGAIATLIDTVVVPAIGGGYDEPRMLLTVDMHVSYLGAVAGQDAVAEGWVEKRGRSMVFCRVEVRSAAGELASTASLVYKVSSRPLEI